MHKSTWMMVLAAACVVAACSSDDTGGGAVGTGGSSGTGGTGTGGSGGSNAGSAGAAGSTAPACPGEIAVYAANASGNAVAPGTKQANAYGLYDMLGNAVEWVQDCYHDTYTGAPADGSAWDETTCEYRVTRGGCYGSAARDMRVSYREGVLPNFYGACSPGVRCVRTSSTASDAAAPKITMQWVQIPAGTFQMGCSDGDAECYENEAPTHAVTVAAFEMTAKEPTQQEFFDQTGESPNPTVCKECAETHVSWDAAKAFCEALGGRLPTEAEWEWAARGGTTTRYYCSE